MTSLDKSLAPERLLAHAEWVRRLARSLVRDPHRAADVEQESWLAALRHPPSDDGDLRAWLARVVRSAAARSARTNARREARERSAARPEALDAAAEVVGEAERQRALVGRVLALEEPYRTVVLLRYFRGLGPRAIAHQLGRPLDTVRSQLQRGLARLRAELEREHGGRAYALAWLLPMTRSSGPLANTAWIGELLMGTTSKIALVTAAALLAFWSLRDVRSGPAPAEERADEVARSTPAPDRTAPETSPAPVREPLEPPPSRSTASPAFELRGRTVDLHARALGGVGVRWSGEAGRDETLETRSNESGTFSLALPRKDALRFDVTDPDRTAVATGWVEDELWLLVAPAGAIEGRVHDEQRRPLSGAAVRMVVNAMSLRDFTRTPDWIEVHRWTTATSDAAGRFRLERAPLVTDAREADIVVSLSGYETAHPRVPERAEAFLEVELAPLVEERPRLVSGLVLSARGVPVADAELVYARASTRSDERGRFALPVEELYWPMALLAVHPEHGFGAFEPLGDWLFRTEADVEGLVVMLGPPPLAIEGRLLHHDGRPATGFHVTLQDGTPLGATAEWAELRAQDGSVAVDAEGRFELRGLARREYTLRAWDPETGAVRLHGPYPAGTRGLELLAQEDALETLVGFAFDRRGRAVPGVTVKPAWQRVPSPYGTWLHAPTSAVTDAAGRFELERVSRRGASLAFDGPHVISSAVEIPPHREGEPVRVVVPLLTRFRVELDPLDPADAFEVLDPSDAVLRLSEFHSWGSFVRLRVARADGGFPVCVTEDAVATLVLYRKDIELRRVALDLESGGVHVVRP